MKVIQACCVTVLLVSFALAADLTGHWSGQIEVTAPDGNVHTQSAFLDLKQEANKITGSGGSAEGAGLPLENVEFDGSKLSFSVSAPDGRTYKSTLALVAADSLEGKLDFTLEDGTAITGKLTLKREPPK